MPRRTADFLFSFCAVVVGVGLLFFASVTFGRVPTAAKRVVLQFPASGARAAEGGDIVPDTLPASKPLVPLAKNTSTFSGFLTAESAVVLDDNTNTALFVKNGQNVRPLASITKLMTALVLSELPLDWSTTTVIVEADIDGNSHHLLLGERFTLDDLWHLALIGSSNSAVQALIRNSGLSEEVFVNKMNKKAEELHLSSFKFVEPTGLSNRNIGSALDVGRLLRETLSVGKIYSALEIGEYYAKPIGGEKPRRVWSTNWLLNHWVPHVFSKQKPVGKTGYIADSGYNFTVQLADDKGKQARVVILGAASNEARFSEARDLAEWTFGHYLWPDEEGYDKLAQ